MEYSMKYLVQKMASSKPLQALVNISPFPLWFFWNVTDSVILSDFYIRDSTVYQMLPSAYIYNLIP